MMSRSGQRKSIEYLRNRRSGKSTSLLIPAWEQICDDILSPSRRLELGLDFEAESKIVPPPYTYASPSAMSRLGKLKRKNAPYTNSPLRVSHAVYSVTGSGGNGSDVAGSGHVTPGDVMEQGRVSKSSSGSRRILRNIPTIKGGVWNALTMRMPKIKFVKRFESVDTLRG